MVTADFRSNNPSSWMCMKWEEILITQINQVVDLVAYKHAVHTAQYGYFSMEYIRLVQNTYQPIGCKLSVFKCVCKTLPTSIK